MGLLLSIPFWAGFAIAAVLAIIVIIVIVTVLPRATILGCRTSPSPTPPMFTATGGAGSVTVNWTPVAGVSGYKIIVTPTDAVVPAVDSVPAGWSVVTINDPAVSTYTVTGLAPSATTYVWLATIGSCGAVSPYRRSSAITVT